MRRFTVTKLVTVIKLAAIAGGILVCFAGRNAALAQNYWAGDVSLAPTAEDNLNQPPRRALPPAVPTRVANARADASQQDGPQLTNQARQVLNFYGGRSAMATLNQMPRTSASAPVATIAQPARRPAKPFESASDRSTISPYLNLFRDEKGSQGIPNYYAFVQPQLEQQAASQRQQIQSQRLQRHGQAADSSAGSQYGVAAQAGSDTSAHFMDTAQFYGAWRR
jgi:hypothetical protein